MDWPRDRTRASAVGGRRLTAWAMARPLLVLTLLPSWQRSLTRYDFEMILPGRRLQITDLLRAFTYSASLTSCLPIRELPLNMALRHWGSSEKTHKTKSGLLPKSDSTDDLSRLAVY
jgi:hypothetical protein